MQENPQIAQFRESLQRLYTSAPKRRFWLVVAGSVGLGMALAAPLVFLLMFHEGPWTGFLWDLLFRLPFLLLLVVLLIEGLRSIRAGKLKEAAKAFLIFVFFGSIMTFFWFEFARHVQEVIHFRRLRAQQVRVVRVACHATDDLIVVQKIVTDLRGAQWYSPDSHGWSPYADLTADGHKEYYSLTQFLAEGRLVVRMGGGDSVLVAVPELGNAMQQAGLLKVASYPRYDNKGYYQAIVPPSVCKQEQIRDN
jgi:hypothetical protein